MQRGSDADRQQLGAVNRILSLFESLGNNAVTRRDLTSNAVEVVLDIFNDKTASTTVGAAGAGATFKSASVDITFGDFVLDLSFFWSPTVNRQANPFQTFIAPNSPTLHDDVLNLVLENPTHTWGPAPDWWAESPSTTASTDNNSDIVVVINNPPPNPPASNGASSSAPTTSTGSGYGQPPPNPPGSDNANDGSGVVVVNNGPPNSGSDSGSPPVTKGSGDSSSKPGSGGSKPTPPDGPSKPNINQKKIAQFGPAGPGNSPLIGYFSTNTQRGDRSGVNQGGERAWNQEQQGSGRQSQQESSQGYGGGQNVERPDPPERSSGGGSGGKKESSKKEGDGVDRRGGTYSTDLKTGVTTYTDKDGRVWVGVVPPVPPPPPPPKDPSNPNPEDGSPSAEGPPNFRPFQRGLEKFAPRAWQARFSDRQSGSSTDDFGNEGVPWWVGGGGGGRSQGDGEEDPPKIGDREGGKTPLNHESDGGDGERGPGDGVPREGAGFLGGGTPFDTRDTGTNDWWRRFGPLAYLQGGARGDDPETNNPRYRGGYFPNPEDTGSPTGPQSRSTRTIGSNAQRGSGMIR